MNILRKQRILSGKTISDAAKESGIPYTTIWRWEAGRCKPNARKLKTICDVYGCPVDEVIGIYNAESGAADAP